MCLPGRRRRVDGQCRRRSDGALILPRWAPSGVVGGGAVREGRGSEGGAVVRKGGKM